MMAIFHFDDLLKLSGGFGLYEAVVCTVLSFGTFASLTNNVGIVFLMAIPQHFCGSSNLSEMPRLNENTTEACECNCESEMIISDGKPCPDWTFDRSVYQSTVVTEWNLVGVRHSLVALATSLFAAGSLVGVFISGPISDRFGRRHALNFFTFIGAVSSIVIVFSPVYPVFLIGRFVNGMASQGLGTVVFVHMMELCGPKLRQIVMTLGGFIFACGYLVVGALAWFFRSWVQLQMTYSLPWLIFIPITLAVPESPRWLYSHGRYSEMMALLKRIARINRAKVDWESLSDGMRFENQSVEHNHEGRGNLLDLIRTPNLRRRSLIQFFIWMVASLTYYEITWNSNDLSPGHDHLSFVLSGLAEVPATMLQLPIVTYIRRSHSLAFSLLLSSLFLVATAIPFPIQSSVLILAMVGKMFTALSFGILYVYTTELFPTKLRTSGLGCASTFARVGSILSAYVALLRCTSVAAPLLLCACLGFVAAGLSCLLPETRNRTLPETIADAETFGGSEWKQAVDDGRDRSTVPLMHVADDSDDGV